MYVYIKAVYLGKSAVEAFVVEVKLYFVDQLAPEYKIKEQIDFYG